jgi:hypothetical protein
MAVGNIVNDANDALPIGGCEVQLYDAAGMRRKRGKIQGFPRK